MGYTRVPNVRGRTVGFINDTGGGIVVDPGPRNPVKPQTGMPAQFGADDNASVSLRDVVNGPNVSTAASVALGYHGYKRTGSIFWALVYAAAGKVFPLEAVPIAVAQGFATKKSCP